MLHLPDDHIAAPSLLCLRGRRSLENVRSLADWCEWIAQFMGKGRKEFILAPIGLAKRNLGALADSDLLPQDIFRSFSLGDVSGDFGGTHDRSVRILDGRDGQGHMDEDAVLSFTHCLVVVDALASPEL